MKEKLINKCCICGADVFEECLTIPFRDILGKPSNSVWKNSYGLCKNCGFIFQRNPFSSNELSSRYKDFSKFEFDVSAFLVNEKSDYAKRCLRQKHFIEENISDGFYSILEIGAASGYNLSLYSDSKTVYGIEPSKLNCTLAKKHYGVEMYAGMFQDFLKIQFESKKYDLVFTSHVLEHIVNPFEFVIQCASICNKYFFIEVPSLDYKYIEEPFGMICEEHVNLFTLEGLCSLMNAAGFELINSEIIFNTKEHIPAAWPAISTIWKKTSIIPRKKKYTISSKSLFKNYISVNKKELQKIDKKISKIPNSEKLALWGMGHHVSMLLANTCLSNKNLVRMYDSDERKQGKIVMGIPISSFDISDIEKGEVDSVLITSYVAQNTIEEILKNNYPNVKLYTLYDLGK